jgi:hypothetical protein
MARVIHIALYNSITSRSIKKTGTLIVIILHLKSTNLLFVEAELLGLLKEQGEHNVHFVLYRRSLGTVEMSVVGSIIL